MYQAGERIVYGNLGVCSVVEVARRTPPGAAQAQLYYTLVPCFENPMRIYTPVENPRVRMRPVVTFEQASRLLEGVPALRAAARTEPPEQLVDSCAQALELRGCPDLIELALLTCAQRQLAPEVRRKMGAPDRASAQKAQQRLLQELGLALQLPPASVRERIASGMSAAPRTERTVQKS